MAERRRVERQEALRQGRVLRQRQQGGMQRENAVIRDQEDRRIQVERERLNLLARRQEERRLWWMRFWINLACVLAVVVALVIVFAGMRFAERD